MRVLQWWKKKKAEDLVIHFQKRCLERIGIILNQRVLKTLLSEHKLILIEKQSIYGYYEIIGIYNAYKNRSIRNRE